MTEQELIAPRDLRYPSLTTSLAILLFLPSWLLIPMLTRMMGFAAEMGSVEMPRLTQLLGTFPRATMIAAFVLMLFTIIFAWSGRRAGILAAVALLFQGIAIFLLLASIALPWIRMMNEMLL